MPMGLRIGIGKSLVFCACLVEQVRDANRTLAVNLDGENVARVLLHRREMNCMAAVQIGKNDFEIALDQIETFGTIGKLQAISEPDFDFIGAEFQSRLEGCIFFEQFTSCQRHPKRSPKLRLQIGFELVFARIEQPNLAIAALNRIVTFMTDQHNSGAFEDMAIIGNIDQQAFQHVLLYPALEHAHERSYIDTFWIFEEKFNLCTERYHLRSLSYEPLMSMMLPLTRASHE